MGNSARDGRLLRWTLAATLLFLTGLLAAASPEWIANRLARRSAPETPAVQQAKAVAGSLDVLEARLTASAAWVAQEADLRRRHAHVSALACTNVAGQVRDMNRLAALHRRRHRAALRASAAKKPAPAGPAGHRLASAAPPPVVAQRTDSAPHSP